MQNNAVRELVDGGYYLIDVMVGFFMLAVLALLSFIGGDTRKTRDGDSRGGGKGVEGITLVKGAWGFMAMALLSFIGGRKGARKRG